MFLLCGCGGLRGGEEDLTWMFMDRYGLGGLFWMTGMGVIRF